MYKTFNNEIAFNEWHNLVNEQLGYPNEDTRTDTYTSSIKLENKENVICVVDDKCPEELLGEIKTLEDVKLLGFFCESEAL